MDSQQQLEQQFLQAIVKDFSKNECRGVVYTVSTRVQELSPLISGDV